MKWDNDKYKDLKWIIHELLPFHLTDEDAEKVTISWSNYCIDEFIDKLTKQDDSMK